MRDVHSFARPDEAVVRHIALNLEVDFERRVLRGIAEVRFEKTPEARRLVLDTHGLTIDRINIDGGGEATFALGDETPFLGRALTIDVDEDTEVVSIHYETSPDAAAELAATTKMIEAAEKWYGPYRWGEYDVLVLPPSFPFGGMENPRLTFATPTILAGDRSLVSLVAHELAHSWSGNLVTNATWNDFWLNEGFTVYFERRIMEAIAGRDYSEMLALLGYQDLVATVAELPPRDTHLVGDLEGRDPDDAATKLPYEKGYSFLRLAEETVGREPWDAFLREYFDQHAFQSMTTRGFLDVLNARFPQLDATINIDQWVNGPGIPPNCPKIHSDAFVKVEEQVRAFESGTPASKLATKQWSTHEWIHFLRHLPKTLTREQMSGLDATFHFTDSGNSEILHEWLLQAIDHQYEAAYPALERFLLRQGRRKFLKPLYQKLAETPEGLARARAIYAKARPMYHAVSYRTIDQILKWSV